MIIINESFKPGDKVTIYSEIDSKYLPDYEIVREATSNDFSKYHSEWLRDFKGKKYVVKCTRPGMFNNTYSIELEKNIKLD